MGMFKMEKPRRFNHQYIYVDERKEKLQKLEEKAKRELGMLPAEEFSGRYSWKVYSRNQAFKAQKREWA